MAISTDTLTTPRSSDRTWRKFTGTGVTVFVPPGNSLDERATQELREAELLLDALRKLLEISEDHPVHINIYLVGSPAEAGSNGSPNGHSDSPGDGSDAIVCIVDPAKPREPLAKPLTRLLAARWFGPDAPDAGPVIEGLAGLAASHAGGR